MNQEAILLPFALLALHTFLVALLIPITRFRAAFAKRVGPGDFRYGESAKVPGDVSLPNRNYMNLLELPVLFYAVCLALYATRKVDGLYLGLAWLFLAMRFAHSAVHLTYNNVMHRLVVFGCGVVTLLAMWLRFTLSLI